MNKMSFCRHTALSTRGLAGHRHGASIYMLAALLTLCFLLDLQAQVYPYATYSSPIALSRDNKLLWVVNPADDSVTARATVAPNARSSACQGTARPISRERSVATLTAAEADVDTG